MPFTNRLTPMSNSLLLKDKMEGLIEQHLPSLRKTRRRNLARLTSGLYRAEHVQAAEGGRLRLLVDTLELSGNRRLLVAALAYRRRALPIWWHVDRKAGVTGGEKQEAFLEELTDLVPSEARAVLIGDGEFHSVDLLQAARQAGWAYCVRLHADTYLRSRKSGTQEPGTQSWKECRGLDPEEGESRFLQEISITKDHDFGPVNLVYHWAEGEEHPWRLVTNLSPSPKVVRLYKRRMWIEELFGDWQEGTFHLHQTRLYKPEKLSRLVLGLSLVYVWLVAVASYVVKRGWRYLIDQYEQELEAKRQPKSLVVGFPDVVRNAIALGLINAEALQDALDDAIGD